MPGRSGEAGKLSAAGRAWGLAQTGRADKARPLRITERALADWAAFGADIPPADAEPEEDVIEVWPENWAVLEVFMALETQWRMAMTGGVMSEPRQYWLGLDYGAADAVIRRFGFGDDDRAVLADLKDMEIAALRAMNGDG